MRLTRRSILASGLAAPFAAMLATPADAALRATRRVGRRARFDGLVGERFELRADDMPDTVVATLVAVDDGAKSSLDNPGCFVLRFELPSGCRAAQAIYTVDHPSLDSFAVLAAPSSMDGRSLTAVFNSPE